MARPTTKTDLVEAADSNFESLKDFIASMTEKELETPFDFSLPAKALYMEKLRADE